MGAESIQPASIFLKWPHPGGYWTTCNSITVFPSALQTALVANEMCKVHKEISWEKCVWGGGGGGKEHNEDESNIFFLL